MLHKTKLSGAVSYIMKMNGFFSGLPCTLEWDNLILVYIDDFKLSENLHSLI